MSETSICDACDREIPAGEAQTCEACWGSFCESHIGDLDHECDEDDEDNDRIESGGSP